MAYTQLAQQVIEPDLPVQKNTVNIVFEKMLAKPAVGSRAWSGILAGRRRPKPLLSAIGNDMIKKIGALRPALQGKRLMIITINHELDRVIEVCRDVDIEIVKIGVIDYSQDEEFRSNLPNADELPVEQNYDRMNGRIRDVTALQPDILLTNYEAAWEGEHCLLDTIPLCPDQGFEAGIRLVERWKHLVTARTRGGWENDRQLFDKYYF